MRIARGMFGLGVVGLAASSFAVGAGVGGCVSSNPTTPPGEDAAFPGQDGALPPLGSDASPDSTVGPADASADTNVPPADGEAPDATDAAPPPTRVRFGWFIDVHGSGIIAGSGNTRPLPAGYDVCLAPHGTQLWQGPLLAGAGLATGLPPLAVSKYFPVTPGANDVLLLPPGTTTCALPDAGADGGGAAGPLLFSNLPPVPPGVTLTVGVVSSDTDPSGFGVVALVDEPAALPGKVGVRFASVAPGVAAPSTLAIGGGAAVTPIFSTTAVQVLDPAADPNGYRAIDPVAAIDPTLGLNGAAFGPVGSTIASESVALPAGTVLSAFEAATAVDGYSPILILCKDGQPSSASAALTACTANDFGTNPASGSYTRFADFIADTPAPLDVCLRYHGTTAPFVGPLLETGALAAADAGADAGTVGLAPPVVTNAPTSATVSGYFNVHGGFAYDVHLVPAGSTGCAPVVTGLADFTYAAPVGPGGGALNATLAATGFVTVPGDAGEPTMFDAGPLDAGPDAGQASPGLSSVALAYVTFVDESYSSSAGGGVRVVHVAAADPQPFDVSGFGPQGMSSPPAWRVLGVPYGTFGSLAPGVDSAGYQAVPASGSPIVITDTIGGATEAQLFTSSLPANGTDTLFVYAYVSGGFTNVAFLQCEDSQWHLGGLWPCTFGNGG